MSYSCIVVMCDIGCLMAFSNSFWLLPDANIHTEITKRIMPTLIVMDPLAEADIHCVHSLGKTKDLLSPFFTSCVRKVSPYPPVILADVHIRGLMPVFHFKARLCSVSML